jgi:hypothetical protein
MTTSEQDTILIAYEAWERAKGPQTPDELHAFIKETFGLDIPRVAVCAGTEGRAHCAPFDAFCDMYFEKVPSALWMTNRGGSKTQLAALWHWLNSKFKKGCEGLSVGAQLEHANRVYERLLELIVKDGTRMTGEPIEPEDHPDVASSMRSKTKWKNTSQVEIVPGTQGAVNGPHPMKVHFDEVELADQAVFQESRNMSLSKHGIKAQDLITSTRKRAFGPMQSIVNEIRESEKAGFDPPYRMYVWCIFECLQNQAHCCRAANPDLPEEDKCDCNKIVKGKWESGKDRTFESVCQGRAARSQGFLPLHDAHKTFRTTTRDVWEAQQECARPSSSGLCVPEFDRTRHTIKGYRPDPANGMCFASVDFGGTNPHAVEFFQVLKRPVMVRAYHQTSEQEALLELKPGTRVFFDEIYKAEIAPTVLAGLVLKRIEYWKAFFPEFRIHKFFYDIQAKGAMLEWANHKPPIILVNYATKEVELHITYIKDLIEEDQFYIAEDRCPFLCDEMEAWHYPEIQTGHTEARAQPVKDFDHAVDAARYGIANLRSLERVKPPGRAAAGGQGHQTSRPTSGPSHYKPTPRDDDEANRHPFYGGS